MTATTPARCGVPRSVAAEQWRQFLAQEPPLRRPPIPKAPKVSIWSFYLAKWRGERTIRAREAMGRHAMQAQLRFIWVRGALAIMLIGLLAAGCVGDYING